MGRDSLEGRLREKWYHSKGAALLGQGLYGEAAECFVKAIAMNDKAYTRADLADAYERAGERDKALEQLKLAISMDPGEPEYYYRRSLVWKKAGNEDRAGADLSMAVALDGNYGRIERIHKASGALEAFLDLPVSWRPLGDIAARSGDVQKALLEFAEPARALREALETARCPVPCPAYCCYFEAEPVLHGLAVGSWKLYSVRRALRGAGLREDEYIGRLSVGAEGYLRDLIPPDCILNERGGTFTYYPLRRSSSLAEEEVPMIPRGRNYRSLAWIHGGSGPCAFLCEGECMIHDAGDEPALPPCKHFYCMTGWVFALAAAMGLIDASRIPAGDMGRLNAVAVDMLVDLGDNLFHDALCTEGRSAMAGALESAVSADERGDVPGLKEGINRYRDMRDRHERIVSTRKESLGKNFRSLLSPLP